ncbi:MAG: hypothetical protein L0387_29700 [Acidobacteria bacterium]|nr:hypothetical protein [Acidobacteriota bacterium]
MYNHLSDEQLVGRLQGATDVQGDVHVEHCGRCRAEELSLRTAIRKWAVQVFAAAERPAGFWYAQERSIHHRLANRQRARALTWAAAVVTVALAVSFSFQPNPPARAVAEIDADQLLLLEVQDSVRRRVPRALEPAALLAEDLSKASQSETPR